MASRLDLLLAVEDPGKRLPLLREYLEDGRLAVCRAEAARDATIRELRERGDGPTALARLAGLSLSRVKQLTRTAGSRQ